MQATQQRFWNRDFTLVIIGQIISIFGNVILRFALNVYVLELTGSAAVFGTVMALSVIPSILLSPVGGMLADRASRRDIMVALDFATAALLAGFVLVLSPGNAVGLISALLMLLATISSFYTTAVQTSIPLLQSGDNLVRGNAVANQVNMVANLVGPVLGGAVYGLFGIRLILWVAVGCFLASGVLELFIRIPFTPRARSANLLATARADFGDSLRFVTKTRPELMRFLIALMAANLFVSSMMTVGRGFMLMTVLGFDSGMYGLSSSLMGAGGLAGGLLAGVLAPRLRVRGLYKMLVAIPVAVLPISLVFVVEVTPMTAFVVITACTTVFSAVAAVFNIMAVSSVQQCTPEHLLGKVYGLVGTVCMAAMPVGNAVYGLLFDAFNDHIPLITAVTALITAAFGLFTRAPCRSLDAEVTAMRQRAAAA